MLNRRMPNGMYGGVRGERKSPLLDRDTPGGVLRASGTRPAPTGAERRPAVLARAGIRRATVIEPECGISRDYGKRLQSRNVHLDVSGDCL